MPGLRCSPVLWMGREGTQHHPGAPVGEGPGPVRLDRLLSEEHVPDAIRALGGAGSHRDGPPAILLPHG